MSGRNKNEKASEFSVIPSPRQLEFSDLHDWPIPPVQSNSVEIGTLPSPIWTETKAQLIQNYLRLFLFITKHGVYIDGFAGPQDKGNPSSWAAKLVVELTPPWMRSLFCCEIARGPYADLRTMLLGQPEIRGRQIVHRHADFNVWVDEVLSTGVITNNTAAFALLDQRSTECHWETVRKLAAHKSGDTKIELFYFFPSGWIHRAISETEDEATLDAWWGDSSWRALRDIDQPTAAMSCLKKVQALGYRDVKSWPISAGEKGQGRTMYHMIHATDHLEAPKLMYRAYCNLIGNVSPAQQTELELGPH